MSAWIASTDSVPGVEVVICLGNISWTFCDVAPLNFSLSPIVFAFATEGSKVLCFWKS